MTGDELIAAGFGRSEPHRLLTPHADAMYQLRVRDDFGTRYFITVMEYHSDDRVTYEADVYYNDGCWWYPSKSATAVKIYGATGISEWTPKQLCEVADRLWRRLNPHHYELDD